jgi:hypothetical protein
MPEEYENAPVLKDAIAHLRGEVNALRGELNAADIQLRAARQERDQARGARDLTDSQIMLERADWKRDIKVISDALLEAAAEQNFCSEFDDWEETVNDKLKGFKLEPRKKEFTVTFDFSLDVTVEATNPDEAINLARETYQYERSNSYGVEQGVSAEED